MYQGQTFIHTILKVHPNSIYTKCHFVQTLHIQNVQFTENTHLLLKHLFDKLFFQFPQSQKSTRQHVQWKSV